MSGIENPPSGVTPPPGQGGSNPPAADRVQGSGSPPPVGAGSGADDGGRIENYGGGAGFDNDNDAYGDNNMPPGAALTSRNAGAAAEETGALVSDGESCSWMFAILQCQKMLAESNVDMSFTETNLGNKARDAKIDATDTKVSEMLKNVDLEKSLGWAKIGTDIGMNTFGTLLSSTTFKNAQGTAMIFANITNTPGQIIGQSQQIQTDRNQADITRATSDESIASDLESAFRGALEDVHGNANSANQHLESFENIAGGIGSTAAQNI